MKKALRPVAMVAAALSVGFMTAACIEGHYVVTGLLVVCRDHLRTVGVGVRR